MRNKEIEDNASRGETFLRGARSQIAHRLFFVPSAAIKLHNFLTRRLIFTVTLSALTLLATYRFARGKTFTFGSSFFFFSSLIEKSFSTAYYRDNRDNPFVSSFLLYTLFLLVFFPPHYAVLHVPNFDCL